MQWVRSFPREHFKLLGHAAHALRKNVESGSPLETGQEQGLLVQPDQQGWRLVKLVDGQRIGWFAFVDQMEVQAFLG